MSFRTDENNNPTAFTTDVAKEAGLKAGIDYDLGTPFSANGETYYTAKLLGDPIAITIKVIDAIGFYTKTGVMRWVYIGIPKEIWSSLTASDKLDVIGIMYQREGGTAMRGLFPRYGQLI